MSDDDARRSLEALIAWAEQRGNRGLAILLRRCVLRLRAERARVQ